MWILTPRGVLLKRPLEVALWCTSNRFRLSSTSKHKLPGNEIRSLFLDYFKSKGYRLYPSSSVIPTADLNTFFVNAGMNQFKSIFLGTVDPNSDVGKLGLVANSQKCVRAGGKHNDIADVGRDGIHHTFFEMLGHWSFNGAIPRETGCAHALSLLTDVYHIPREHLYFTYFEGHEQLGLPSDEESKQVWLNLGVSKERIFPGGISDNFWEMAGTGPCGPCTEILHVPNPHDGVETAVELWNLVFMQYNRVSETQLLPLKAVHMDTGLGLERLTSILQGVSSNYDTDLFIPILTRIQQLTQAPAYSGRFGAEDDGGLDTAYRILADHSRMFTVAIADGGRPSAKGNNYALRKIIRRALFYTTVLCQAGKTSGAEAKVLSQLCSVVTDSLSAAYPQLVPQLTVVSELVLEEATHFNKLLGKAKSRYGRIARYKKETLTREDFFKYNGAGLTEEIVVNIAKSYGL